MIILEVTGLSAGYENGYVIQDISFSLQKGEFLSVLGKNGSGKSTLIKALQGLLKKISGRVLVDNRDAFALSPRQMAKNISYVPQIFSPSFEFSVKETVVMGRYAHQGRWGGASPDDSRIIDEVMAITNIAHLKEKKVAHLSGGERQRVFIARALAQDTPLLFLDEPSSHLDIRYQVEIYQILKRLQEEKEKAILTTEHNINLAIPYSQQIMFLKDGRVQALGPPEKLVTKENIQDVFEASVEVRENIHSKLPEISLIPRPGQKT